MSMTLRHYEPLLAHPETLKLVTTGRRTGLPHVVELRYFRHEGSYFVLAGDSNSDWVRNVRLGDSKVRLGDFTCNVNAVESSDDRVKVFAAFKKKYGARTVEQWYSTAGLCLRLTPLGPYTRRGAARGELEVQSNFNEWKQQGIGYYHAVQDAFDSAAEEYDFTISNNFINNWIRKKSIQELLRFTTPQDVLLEIGCGTGAEAIQISKSVKRIVATDLSNRMLEIFQKKILAKKLVGKITVANAKASEITNVKSLLPNGTVRVAYSFNGALNCEPEINKVPEELAEIIEPNGYFVCSIRNTLCLSELLAHAAAMQFDRLETRKHQPVMVSVGGIDIPTYYSSPSQLSRILKPHFKLKRLTGLPGLLPPAYLNNYYLKIRSFTTALEKFEAILANRFPFNRLGDQTLMVFQRR
jgi:ubiquinone/menaquinone biosynthesis C-methylase UbiE